MGWLDAVISAAGTYLNDKQKAKDDASASKAKNKDEYQWSARLERYNAALKDYYKMRDVGEKRAAASEYGKFSSLDKWAPGYTQTYKPLEAPSAPPTEANVLDNSYFRQYTGGKAPAASTNPQDAPGFDPRTLLHNGINGDYEAYMRDHPSLGG